MLAWRADKTAARKRGLAAGSARPERAAVVSSRIILVNTLARFLSCAPFRYMMFLNCEWPAIDLLRRSPSAYQPEAVLLRGLTIQYGRIGAPRRAVGERELALTHPALRGWVPPLLRCGRGAARLLFYSPSPE